MIVIHEDDDYQYTLNGKDRFEWSGIWDQFKAIELGLSL